MFFLFFKLCKWYQIAQNISYSLPVLNIKEEKKVLNKNAFVFSFESTEQTKNKFESLKKVKERK